MKKLLFILVLCTLIFTFNSLVVHATYDEIPPLIDDADLFSSSEEQTLTNAVMYLYEEYDYDIYLITIGSLDGYPLSDWAEEFPLNRDRGGVVFIINMEPDNRGYYTQENNPGLYVFTDKAYDAIDDDVQPLLADGDYYDAFLEFLYLTEEFLIAAESGEYYGTGFDLSDYTQYAGLSILFGIFIAFIVNKILVKQMNTAVEAAEASNYLKSGSLNITVSRDRFLYENTTRVAIPKKSSSGGGSSGGGSRGRGGSF